MVSLFCPITEITFTFLLVLSTDPIRLYEQYYEQRKSGCHLHSYGDLTVLQDFA